MSATVLYHRCAGQAFQQRPISLKALPALQGKNICAKRLGYLGDREWQKLDDACDEVGRVLYGLAKSIETCIHEDIKAPAVG